MSEPTEEQRAAAEGLAGKLVAHMAEGGPLLDYSEQDQWGVVGVLTSLIAEWLAQREQAAEGLARALKNIGGLLDFAQRDNTADTLIVTSLVAIRIVNEAEAALAQWEGRDK